MKAMILAAGLGTRLRPLTEKTPKALILVNNRPLILYGLLLLKKQGIEEVLINLHHLGSLVEKEFGDGQKIGMRLHYSWEEEILGTGGGIKKGEAFFEGQPFFVLNSDILIDVDLKKLWSFHQKKKGIASMVVKRRPKGSEYSWIRLGKGNRILEISERGANQETMPEPSGLGSEESTYFYTGLQILEPKLLSYLPTDGPACVIRNGYHPALAAKEKVFGWIYDGYWNDLGTLDRHREAESDLASSRIRLSFLD